MADPPRPGTFLGNKYRVERVVGSGGMGVVVVALHAQLQERVAIKLLLPEVARRPGAVERFVREARVSMRLRSEHAVRIHDVGTFDDGTPFIAMEYLEGRDLASLARERGPMPTEEVVDAVLQACEALAEAHALGVVHRDLKPANLFVTQRIDGTTCIKVLDFGVSKVFGSSWGEDIDALSTTAPGSDRLRALAPTAAAEPTATPTSATRTNAVIGSPRYMAPEQLESARDVDARADIWSLGVVLYELISGAPPFDADDFERLRAAILKEPVRPLPAALDVDPDLAAVIARCLAKDRAARFADVRALVDALAPFASDEGRATADRIARMKDVATGASVAPRAQSASSSSSRRSSRRALASWLVVALLGSVAAFFVVRSARAPSPASAPSVASSSAASSAPATRAPPSAFEGCDLLAEPDEIDRADTIWIGAMFPMHGPAAEPVGIPSRNAVDLARRDFRQVAHGVPRKANDGPPRPFAIVACDDSKDAQRIARHLADDVHVPAVIGFHTSGEVIELASSVFMERRVLVVPSMNISALITAIPTPAGAPRLVWRTSLSSTQTAAPVAKVIEDFLEPRLRTSNAVGEGASMRVALVRTRSTAGMSVSDAVFRALRFNGKSASENRDAFREFVLDAGGGADAGSGGMTFADAVRALLDFKPHVVVYADPDELSDPLFRPFETRWPAQLAWRPYYVSVASLAGPRFTKLVLEVPERRRRFFGVSTVAATPANTQLTMHYNETFDPDTTVDGAPASAYDAAYLVAYGAYVASGAAAPDAPLTGPSLARAFERLLPPGPAIDVGPPRIFEVLEHLRAGENVDLNGAYSRLDFDVTTGESPADFAIQCVDAKRGVGVDSGLVYQAATRTLSGSPSCGY